SLSAFRATARAQFRIWQVDFPKHWLNGCSQYVELFDRERRRIRRQIHFVENRRLNSGVDEPGQRPCAAVRTTDAGGLSKVGRSDAVQFSPTGLAGTNFKGV